MSAFSRPRQRTVTGDTEVGRRHGGEADGLMLLEEAGGARIQQTHEVASNDCGWSVVAP